MDQKENKVKEAMAKSLLASVAMDLMRLGHYEKNDQVKKLGRAILVAIGASFTPKDSNELDLILKGFSEKKVAEHEKEREFMEKLPEMPIQDIPGFKELFGETGISLN